MIKLRTKRNVQWEEDGQSCEPRSRNETDSTPDNQEQNQINVIEWKELKIAIGDEIAAINAWGDKVEEELRAVDKNMDSVAKYLSEMDHEQVEKSRRE